MNALPASWQALIDVPPTERDGELLETFLRGIETSGVVGDLIIAAGSASLMSRLAPETREILAAAIATPIREAERWDATARSWQVPALPNAARLFELMTTPPTPTSVVGNLTVPARLAQLMRTTSLRVSGWI